ncbi:MAG: helix-turn-helix domain-containing protein [Bilifractor sp.]
MIEQNHYISLAEQLHTMVRIYDLNNRLQQVINRSISETLPEDLPPETEKFILGQKPCGCPITVQIDGDLIYTLQYTPDRKLIIGPDRLNHNFNYKRTFRTENHLHPEPGSVYQTDIYAYQSILIPSYNLFFEQTATYDLYFSENFASRAIEDTQYSYTREVFQNREANHSHNPYSQESRMLSSIENGDLKLLEKCRSEEVRTNFGTLAENDSRNIKDLCICVVTLVSRAAIRGGVNYELAFSLCDSYIMQIEKTSDLYEVGALAENAKTTFCLMVKNTNERKNPRTEKRMMHPLVEKTKDYIFKHLHARITLSGAAQAMGTSPNYLSNLFVKYESKSFSDFVRDEKVRLIKNLLVYSDYSYIEIANYLGYASQSHMGKVFRKATGYTLKHYRDQFSSTEFGAGS